MSKTINLNRRIFGGLEVLQYAGTNKHRSAMWKVRCRCGTVKDVEGKRLRNGEAQSCGCSHFLRPFEALHNVLISRSAQRPVEVSLSYEDFLQFTRIKECHYCSANITWDERGQRYNLDRKRNLLGYSKENCVVCCKDCNYIKSARFTYEQMIQIGALINSWRNNGNN